MHNSLYIYLDQNAEFLRQPTRNRIKFGHPLVSGPQNIGIRESEGRESERVSKSERERDELQLKEAALARYDLLSSQLGILAGYAHFTSAAVDNISISGCPRKNVVYRFLGEIHELETSNRFYLVNEIIPDSGTCPKFQMLISFVCKSVF
eukprot:sb/3473568/